MKLLIDINNQGCCPVRDSFFKLAARRSCRDAMHCVSTLKNKIFSVSLAVVDEKEIKKLNRLYRKRNKVTDVLSFAEYKSAKALREEKSDTVFLGEIILCYNDIAKYSQEHKLDLESKLKQTISHGVLHLLGFRHGKKMFEIQNK